MEEDGGSKGIEDDWSLVDLVEVVERLIQLCSEGSDFSSMRGMKGDTQEELSADTVRTRRRREETE